MKKPLSEKETRLHLFAQARELGCSMELKKIFDRYDALLKRCQDEKERKDIAIMANAELHRLFSFRNALVVDGQEIIPADENYDPDVINKILS